MKNRIILIVTDERCKYAARKTAEENGYEVAAAAYESIGYHYGGNDGQMWLEQEGANNFLFTEMLEKSK